MLADGGVLFINFFPQADQHGVCAFLVYFIMSGYQFKQAQAVLNKLVWRLSSLQHLVQCSYHVAILYALCSVHA